MILLHTCSKLFYLEFVHTTMEPLKTKMYSEYIFVFDGAMVVCKSVYVRCVIQNYVDYRSSSNNFLIENIEILHISKVIFMHNSFFKISV